MLKTIARWGVSLTSLFVVGPATAWLTSGLQARDGSDHTSFLLADSPVKGVFVGLVALIAAGATGVTGARLVGTRSGFFAAGVVLAWATWGTGTMDYLMRQPAAGSFTWRLAVEGVLIGVAAIAIATAIIAVGRVSTDAAGGKPRASLADAVRESIDDALGRTASDSPIWQPLATLAVALVVAGIATWLMAAECLKGQVLAATTVAGLLAATTGMLVSMSGDDPGKHGFRIPTLTFFVALAVLGVASPVIASIMHSGGAGVVEAATTGDLFPVSRPLPLDWIAGAFLGIPIGLTWGESLVERHAPTG